MPRAGRYFTTGRCYHVTQRCHNRDVLLRFAKDRNFYRDLLRDRLSVHHVKLLAYNLTSNHVHLILSPTNEKNLSCLMHDVAGEYARYYNRRKKRSNAVWGGRYYATLVDGGDYLWRCMKYVDLNMVRANVVKHPEEWEWCGYQEIIGKRKRYTLLDMEQVVDSIGMSHTLTTFNSAYIENIEQTLNTEDLVRDPKWTESLAVGNPAFVKEVQPTIKNRRRFEEKETLSSENEWVLKESMSEYA